MKKLILLALVIMAGASFNGAFADKKKTNKGNAKQEGKTVVVMKTSSDSISYAAGKAATQGLIPFLQQQYQVDTTYMADFIQGFKEAQTKVNDPKYNAYIAGTQIASMVEKRILPQTRNQFEGAKDSIEQSFFTQGFLASLGKDNSVYTDEAARKMFETRMKAEKEIAQKAYKEENEAWLKTNAQKDGMKTTPSGLQYKVLVAGTGAMPKADDEVVVKYEGKLIDGTVFDSSYKRNPQTSTFKCNQVIKGWTEALTMMPTGSKWEVCIPQDLAYGERQAGKIKPYSTLVFTVELVEIKAPKKEEAKPAEKATTVPATKINAAAKKTSTTAKKK